jgi:hypothetical protein
MAIRHRAYHDGLMYLRSAVSICRTHIEFKALLKLADQALVQLVKVRARGGGIRLSLPVSFGGSSAESAASPVEDAYNDIKDAIERQLADLRRARVPYSRAITATNVSSDSSD